MFDYLLTATCISLVILATCQLLGQTPAVLRFRLIMLAVVAWFIPWQHVGVSALSSADFSGLIDSVAPVLGSNASSVTMSSDIAVNESKHTVTSVPFSFDFTWLLFAVLVIGALVFLGTVRVYLLNLKRLQAQTRTAAQYQSLAKGFSVFVGNVGTPALATGLFSPKIWLDESIEKSGELTSVLTHEANHLKHKDTVWMWFLCLFSCLFWWNPICLMLNKYARQCMELRCDEACYEQLDSQYQQDLASLTLKQYQTNFSSAFWQSPLLNMAQSQSFNVQRVKSLNKEKKMKAKHLLLLTAGLSFSALAASQIGSSSAQQTTKAVAQADAHSDNYDAQMADLLKGAKGAKTNDPEQLEQAAQFIIDWHGARTPLQGFEEVDIKVKSFTLLDHSYHKLEQYENILAAYDMWYPQDTQAPAFIKNRLASAYLKLDKPDLAIEQLQSLSDELDGKLEPGSAISLARAYIESGDYEQAISAISIESLEGVPYADALKYYAYDKLNDQVQAQKLKAGLPEAYAVSPAILPPMMMPSSPLLAQL